MIPATSPRSDSNPLLDAALIYAEDRGLKVFPCGNKRPLTPHGFRDASSDPEQIRAWWERHPGAQIGIATGHGFWVLDVDGPQGEKTLADIAAGRPIYTTNVQTSRGRHYWFRGDGIGTWSEKDHGIDARGVGGYVIGPPSIHETGWQYAWTVPLDDMAEAPEWLIEGLAEFRRIVHGQGPNAAATIPTYTAADELPPLTEPEVRRIGEALNVIREAADSYPDWIEVGMALHHHTRGSKQAWEIWLSWSRLSHKFKDADDCWKHWRSFGRREREVTIATVFHRAAAASPDPVVSAAFANAAPLPPEATGAPLQPILSPIELEHATVRAYATTPAAPMRWIVEGMIPRGKLGFLGAQGGAGKTEIAMQLAVAMATGRPWLGKLPISPGPVRSLILLGEDDPESAHILIERVCVGMDLLDDEKEIVDANVKALALAGQSCPLGVADHRTKEVLATTHLGGLMRILEREAERLDATGERCPYGLIIVDTCARFGPAETEIDNAAATRYCQILERLTKAPGFPTILVLAHTPKSARGAEPGDFSLRGSTALSDSARFVLALCGDGVGQSGELWVHKANFKADRTRFRLVRPHEILRVDGAVDLARNADDSRAKKVGTKTRKKLENAETSAEASRRAMEALVQKAIPFVLPIVQAEQGIPKGRLLRAVGRAAVIGDASAQAAIEALVEDGTIVTVGKGTALRHYTRDHIAVKDGQEVGGGGPSLSWDFSPIPPMLQKRWERSGAEEEGGDGHFSETIRKRHGNDDRQKRPGLSSVDQMAEKAVRSYEARKKACDDIGSDTDRPLGSRLIAYVSALPGAFRGTIAADFEEAGVDREMALSELDQLVIGGSIRVESAEYTGKQFYYPAKENQ